MLWPHLSERNLRLHLSRIKKKVKQNKENRAMERREDLETILAYLPLVIQDSSLSWPSSHLVEVLEALTKGPSHSRVDSGQTLSDSISDMRQSLSLTPHLSYSALQGYALFFDEVI